jgi:hypothetical protein
MGRQEFLLQCLGLVGAQVPEYTAQDDQGLTLELSLGDDLWLDVSVAWDEPGGRFMVALQSASEDQKHLELDKLLLHTAAERATLAARWLRASACPIVPVITVSGRLQWQVWLLPNDRGLGGFADFAAWALAFHTLFAIEPDQRTDGMQMLPPSPDDWLDIDRMLDLQWTPGQWAQALASRTQDTGQWVDPAGLVYRHAWPEDDQPGMATAVLQDLGPRLGLPGSSLGPTLASLNGLLHPHGCCLGLDGRHNLRLLATLSPATAEQDLTRLPKLADAVRSLLRLRQQASETLIEQALSSGWVPDTLVFR